MNTKTHALLDVAALPLPMCQRIQEFCERLPDGKVATSRMVVQALGVNRVAVAKHACEPTLAPYRVKLRTTVYWGNPQTIQSILKPSKL